MLRALIGVITRAVGWLSRRGERGRSDHARDDDGDWDGRENVYPLW